MLGPDDVVFGVSAQAGGIGDDVHVGESLGDDIFIFRFKREHIVVACHIGDGNVVVVADFLHGRHHAIIVVGRKDVRKGLGCVFHGGDPIIQQVPQNDQFGNVIPSVEITEEPRQINGMIDQPGVGAVHVHMEIADEYQFVSSRGGMSASRRSQCGNHI